jgi:hypothetical protein
MDFSGTNRPADEGQDTQASKESWHSAQKPCEKGADIHYLPPRTDLQPSIPKTPAEALQHMRALFNAFSGDPAATAELVRGTMILLREFAPHGRPSGASPPPKVWWKDKKSEYASPYDFVIEHYSCYFSKGWTRASLLGPEQDKPLYYALAYWLKHNMASVPEKWKPHFMTKKELNNKQVTDLGGRVTPETVPDLRERNRLHKVAHRLYG